jgi:ribosomal protein L31
MANLHPKYKELRFIMTDGTECLTRSTLGLEKLQLTDDKHTHPAWNMDKDNFVNANAGSVQEFSRRFGDLDFMN